MLVKYLYLIFNPLKIKTLLLLLYLFIIIMSLAQVPYSIT